MFTLKNIRQDDLQELIELVKNCYEGEEVATVTRRDPGGKGYLDGRRATEWLNLENAQVVGCLEGQTLIGGAVVRSQKNDDGNEFYQLITIFVLPNYRGNGSAQAFWQLIEKQFPAGEWVLEIPLAARREHNFFVQKCNFRVAGMKSAKHLKDGAYYMKKRLVSAEN